MKENLLERYQELHRFNEGIQRTRFVLNSNIASHWLEDGKRFWYLRELEDGREFRMVDIAAQTNELAFDHDAFAKAASGALGEQIDPKKPKLIIQTIQPWPLIIEFAAQKKFWRYEDGAVREIELPAELRKDRPLSPDRSKGVFLKDCNLWQHDVETGKDTQLTFDGVPLCDYGRGPRDIGKREERVDCQVCWSPDSRYILTYRLDRHGIKSYNGFYPVPPSGELNAVAEEVVRASAGDEVVETHRFCIIDTVSGEIVQVDRPPLPVVSLDSQFSYLELGWWSKDAKTAYLVELARGAKAVRLIAIKPQTGAARILIEDERPESFVSFGSSLWSRSMIKPLADRDEVIWYSERSGWGHLYLYDLSTGALKRQLTDGDWPVLDIVRTDERRDELWIYAGGREEGVNPYYRSLCRVSLETGVLREVIAGDYNIFALTPRAPMRQALTMAGLSAHYADGFSPDLDYFAATKSRVDMFPETVLYDRDGKQVMALENAQDFGLPQDFVWPESVTFKSADGQWDCWGVIYRPPGFDPNKKYPVIDASKSFPLYNIMPLTSFAAVTEDPNGHWFNMVACGIASMGFIVVLANFPGQPERSKAFQDAHYGEYEGANTLEDRISGIRQLAERYPEMDIDNVGVLPLADGNAAGAVCVLKRPDFYKAGVCYMFDDPRIGCNPPGLIEQIIGVRKAEPPYTPEDIEKFHGRLLVMGNFGMPTKPRGDFPGGVGFYTRAEAELQLVEACRRAGKDVDMHLQCNVGRSWTREALRRCVSYMVKHLRGEEPLTDFGPENLQLPPFDLSLMFGARPVNMIGQL